MTRTAPGAHRTAARLEALGYAPLIRPVLAVQPIDQPPPDLTGIAALAFTSPNGVTAFAALSPDRSRPVFAVGEATAAQARQAGFTQVTSADGALADLARTILNAAPGRVLVPGAREPAGDLRALLGGTVETVILPVYQTVETGVAAPEAFEAVLLHSPRAARAVAAALRACEGGRRALAVAISAAAAAPLGPALDAARLAEIRIADSPTDAAVLLALGKPPARV